LEATARGIAPGMTEDEVAGHLAHRLMRHGARPLALQVAGDGRGRRYPRPGPTAAPLRRSCTLQVTAEKFGLFATAARSVCFGMPDTQLRGDWDLAVRLNVVCLAVSRGEERVGKAVERACQAMAGTEAEHAWRVAPLGYRTGHAAAEG